MEQKIRPIKNFAHLTLAAFANLINNFPSRDMVIIGVTGTDGKTTTSSLLYHILKSAGKKVALISTIGAFIDGKEYETGFHVTTPSYFKIQKYLKMAKEEGCTHVVMEVTSHALDQNRVFGINFDIGILTNITNEHLNYHKNYEKYVLTKLKLLKSSKLAIVNSDGKWFKYISEQVNHQKLRTYSLNGTFESDTTLKTLPLKIETELIGDFNKENIIAASMAALLLNILPEEIEKAIPTFKAPTGRQQIIKNSKIGMIMIDFAHTPGAFEKILPEVRRKTEGRLFHVFGSAGQRDKDKRSNMGEISSTYSDVIVLTAEDPRGEDVGKINDQIKSGIAKSFKQISQEDNINGKSVIEIDDRKDAIEFAIRNATLKDTVLVTGKGHEKTMNYGNGEIPWSDEEAILEALN